MTEQEIVELAAILVNEHGHSALRVAEARRAQHAHEPGSDSFRLWTQIEEAVARLLGAAEPAEVRDERRWGPIEQNPDQ